MTFTHFARAFLNELIKRGTDQLEAGPAVVACAECGSTATRDWSVKQPCCGRTLCGRCARYALVFRWAERGVLRCDHYQEAASFRFGP